MHASEHAEGEACHCYDNLLWYFDHNYRKIVSKHQVDAKEEERGEKRKSDELHQEGGVTQGQL